MKGERMLYHKGPILIITVNVKKLCLHQWTHFQKKKRLLCICWRLIISIPSFLKMPWKFISCLVCIAISSSPRLNCAKHQSHVIIPGPNLFQNIRRKIYLHLQKSLKGKLLRSIAHVCTEEEMATAVLGRCVLGQLNRLRTYRNIAKVTSAQSRNISFSQRLLGGRCHVMFKALSVKHWDIAFHRLLNSLTSWFGIYLCDWTRIWKFWCAPQVQHIYLSYVLLLTFLKSVWNNDSNKQNKKSTPQKNLK